MGETEIEEGEACDYMDNSDPNNDIDVALSYLVRVSDDRIQDILGQYQKDFEGGVSAETLGPRFGGYGSFLPTYQRSPPKRSNPATQQKVQSHGMLPPSHDDRLTEGASRKTTSSLHETISARPTAALRSSSPLPLARPLPEDRLVKIQSSREHVFGYEPLQLPVNQSDQKMLKLRIKVGSDNCLPEQKISEIYSNLGLDMSPSLSSEDTDSPSEWERDFPDSLEEQMDSPTCIVRIMTSSIQSGAMLSPLHDCWLHLSEQKESSDHERTIPVKECPVVWADEKVPVKKQKKPKNESSMDTSNRNHMLSDARNHPPESKATKMGEVAAGTGTIFRTNMSGAKEETFSQKTGKMHEVSAKTTLTRKVLKDKKLGCDPRNNGGKGDKSLDLSEEDDNLRGGMRKCVEGTLDLTKQKFEKKKASHLHDDVKVSYGGKQLSSGKKKSKGNKYDCISTAGVSNNSMRINLSAEPKEKTFQKSSPPCRSKEDNALLKNLSKVKVKHPVLIGDSKAGRSKSRNHLLGTSVGDETVDCISGVHEKKTLAFRNKSKVSSVDKKPSLVSTSKANLRGDINGGAPAGLLPMEVAPYLIEENWVCCDKCHKWRLLPYGTNPDQLPQKWLCTMLDWLPGMNRCAVSEEETTDTQRARCRLSVAANHDGRPSHSVSTESSITFVNTWHDLDQNPQDLSFSGGKKKHEIKVVSNPAQCSLPKKLLNSTRKNEHVSTEKRVQNRSLPSWEKKLQQRLGDVQPQKSKTKREADQESFKLSKKARTDSMHFAEEDHNTGGFLKKKLGSNDKLYSSSREMRCLTKNSTNLYVNSHSGYRGSGYNGHGEEEEKV
ncbi:hypothetical protein OIU78_021260 [Salix suchowensis]|nr:hypothetical protein OIU78_021260 [Salix suchowensis]